MVYLNWADIDEIDVFTPEYKKIVWLLINKYSYWFSFRYLESNPITDCELQSVAFWALGSQVTLMGTRPLERSKGKVQMKLFTSICFDCGEYMSAILTQLRFASS